MQVALISKPLIMEPLGLMYLSAAAKRAGHKVDLLIADENLESKLLALKPQVLGYSVMTGDQQFYASLNRKLQSKFSVKSIFGGPHPTFFPEFLKEDGVDIICRGEGEEAFVEFLDAFEKNRDLTVIRNLGFKTASGFKVNELRPLADIDSLPFPDRGLVVDIPTIANCPIRHFVSSRGCPFNCSYCFNESYAHLYQAPRARVRLRKVDSVITEILETSDQYPTKFIYFQDDTFTLNASWLSEFAEKYASKVNLPFHCHVRANTLDEDRADSLKRAGCFSVHMAAETANDRIRNDLLNRNMTRKQITEAARLLRSKGIRFMMQNMIGLPTGTLQDDLDTLELNIECRPDYSWVSIFQPYPGTSLGEYCREKGLYSGDFNDLSSSFFDGSRLSFSEEYTTQLKNLQKLFAILVEFPGVHRMGLSRVLVSAPRTPEVIAAYDRAYREFRAQADERLYGFKI